MKRRIPFLIIFTLIVSLFSPSVTFNINREASSRDKSVQIGYKEADAVWGLVIRTIFVNGVKASKHLYKSIKYAPKYPAGFKAVQNGTKKVTVNNKKLLSELKQIEGGAWKKVYKDGYKDGKKVSVHYFQSKSGLVYDVKVKKGWSVK
ncbi:hypothetical protein IHP27_13320 [Bacillus safensis]|uniref:hypothetical protein n=1 Tax=Bacillus safensis TaxID=561879 RepID=UPI001B3A59E3|nr:hypothetical protein [Bacillus safensis]MBQ4840981.1 hypothetical protein [Bacillus safensis]MBQ4873519.1 hypothetical protein [Bacillus safensis]MBQ4887145.1 hypothetical protein [Bacillus safensis]